jgi:CHAD domain-containing protein
MIDLIKNYLTKAIKRTGKNRYRIIPKVLHKQRMLLKEIRFCLEMSGDMVSEPDAEEQITKIKEMEDLLGSWHDYNILNRAVEKQMQKLKKPEVENVIKMNSLTHTISNDIILLLDKYRKSIPNLIITGL